MTKTYTIPEILAPCGSYDVLKTAVNAGCDACYIGGDRFGARAYAENLGSDYIFQAIDYAHLHGVKLYLTINTLFKNNEIKDIKNFLAPYYEAGIDAVIVQDLGVFKVVRKLFPDLHIHLSTQMNITSKHGAAYMKKLGATRVVAAREMNISEIKRMKENVDIELEVFVHGAMCYSYSGQCLISSLAGGRSGNRGRCAQPCRKCYNGDYIFSMKDMCALTELPQLMDAGVDSLKIEGRMKNEYYVASAVEAYRTIRDDYMDGNYNEEKALRLKQKLANIYNRGGFTDGYFFWSKDRDMISKEKPNNMGVKVGSIVKIHSGQLEILLEDDIYKQDVLETTLKTGDSIEITSPSDYFAGDTASFNAPKTKLAVIGATIYRTRCNHLLDDITRNLQNNPKRLPIDFKLHARVGEALTLNGRITVNNNSFMSTIDSDYIIVRSNDRPADKTDIEKKLGQLNETNYRLSSITFDFDDNIFIPASEIKKLRRSVIENLNHQIIANYRRDLSIVCQHDTAFGYAYTDEPACEAKPEVKPLLKVSVTTIEQLCALLSHDGIYAVYVSKQLYGEALKKGFINRLEEKGMKLYIMLPYLIQSDFEINAFLSDIRYHGLYIRNIDGFAAVLANIDKDKLSTIDIVCASSFYAYNDEAIAFIKEQIPHASFETPAELNLKELKSLRPHRLELFVYGYQRVMVSAQCVRNNLHGCNKGNDVTTLADSMGNVFYAKAYCEECLGLVFNGIPYSLIHKLERADTLNPIMHKIDFTIEDGRMTDAILNTYREKNRFDIKSTTGHMFRGVD